MPTPVARFMRRMGRRDWGLLTLGVVLGLLVLITGRSATNTASNTAVHEITVAAYRQDIEAWHARLAGCERGKLDRSAIASALRAQSDYLNLVLQADSVQQDVKRAAAANQDVQNASATDLESRTGDSLSCSEVNPKPRTPDGVKERP